MHRDVSKMLSAFRSKLFRQYFRRYLLILGVSGAMLLTTNIISLTNAYGRLTDNAHRFMAHATELLDNRILELQQLTLFVSRDSELLPYRLQEQFEQPYLISGELSKLKAPSIDLDSIGLFYRNTLHPSLANTIFTDTGMYSPESYIKLIAGNKISTAGFRGMLEQLKAPVLLSSLSNESKQGDRDQVLLFLVPLDGTPYSSGVMVYKLNYPALLQNFKQIIDSRSNLIVFDRQGTPIVYLADDPKLEYASLARAQEQGGRLPGYLLLQETSAKQEFQVVSGIRHSLYYHEYYVSLAISIAIILLSIVLGMALSFRSARKSYEPIQELSSSFADLEPAKLKEEGGKDELARLSEYIRQIRDESVNMSNMMNNQEVLSRNQLLQALLMGKLNVDNTSEANQNALRKYFGESAGCNVLVFLFDEFNAKVGKEPLSEQWLLKYVIGNAFENLTGDHGVHYALDLAVDKGIVGIVAWHRENAGEWEERSRAFAAQIGAFMQRHFSLSLSCFVGELQPASELHQSFSSALALAEFRIFSGKQAIITPTEIDRQRADQTENDKRHILSFVAELNAAVSSRQPDKLVEIMRELEARFLWLEDPTAFRSTYLQMVFSLNQFVNNIPLAHREAIKYKLDGLAEAEVERIEEACANLMDAAHCIQDSLGEESGEDRLYGSMLEFVAAHYIDCNLSLSMVAEKLSLTPSYVTRYFKTKNGLPLMQYVSKVRIDKAKELLETGSLTIKEVVERVGFVDENNFSRAFRKREGVSPTKFRSMRQLSGIATADAATSVPDSTNPYPKH
ncbi:hypothetical protein B1748_07550 [Paenibacillus sp. MY03]|nr:hypothetical protein B1748_07550 [Paenibacillus sp. MY03]